MNRQRFKLLAFPLGLIIGFVLVSCRPNMEKYKEQNDLYEKFVVQNIFYNMKYQELWLPHIGEPYVQFAQKTDTLCNEFFEKSFLVQDFNTCVKDYNILYEKVNEIVSKKEFFLPGQTKKFMKQTQIEVPLETYDDLFVAYLKLKSYSISLFRSSITTCGLLPAIFEIDTLKSNKSISISAYIRDIRNQYPIGVDFISLTQEGKNLINDARICDKPSLFSINLPLTDDPSPIQLVTSYKDSFSDSLKIDTFVFSKKRIYNHGYWHWPTKNLNSQ